MPPAVKQTHSVKETVDNELQEHIRRLAMDMQEDLRELRRHLHRMPEVSESEHGTTRFLANRVSELRLEPRFGRNRRGFWVDVGGHENRSLIRSDIDALPIQTELQTPYASEVPGVMHACGHDAHATMAMGALRILNELSSESLPDSPSFSSRVLFQPAEETSTGALEMIDSGVLNGINCAFGLHVDPSRRAGRFGARQGVFTSGCDVFHVEVLGKSGHSARPHLSGDTAAASAAWINDAIARIPRCHDSREPIVLSVGTIRGGTASNVVPSRVSITGTLRSASVQAETAAKRMLASVVNGIEARFNVNFELSYTQHTPPLHNDEEVSNCLRQTACAVFGEEQVDDIREISLGAEDFAFFAQHVPTAMMRLGVGNDAICEPLHSPRFDIDESTLWMGAALLAASAVRWAQRPVSFPCPTTSS
jgi:IAA-amino acid hydrolase